MYLLGKTVIFTCKDFNVNVLMFASKSGEGCGQYIVEEILRQAEPHH